MKKILVLLLALILASAGCIKGNAEAGKNASNINASMNETRIIEKETSNDGQENATNAGNATENESGFLPWKVGFKDLKTFYISYYYVKAGYLDWVKTAYLALPGSDMGFTPDHGVMRIWFNGNELRIDRYDENYQGKDLCWGSPTEFIEENGIRYALTVREYYNGNMLKEWKHTIVNKAITAGSIEKWKCEMKFSADAVPLARDTPAKAMERAYGLYANRYAKPGYYAGEDEYIAEAEKTKRAYEKYYVSDGTRYVREMNALKQNMRFLNRDVRKFYVEKPWGGYGYELRDVELGLGLAFHMDRIKDDNGVETILDQPLLVYTMLEFNETVNNKVFDIK